MICGGVEFAEGRFTLMTVKIDERIGNVLGKSIFRNAPDLECAVIRCRGEKMLMERVEVEIKNGARVSRDNRTACLEPSDLSVRAHVHWATTTLKRNSKELGVRFNIVLLASCGTKLQVGVALVRFGRFYINMAEFGCANEVTHAFQILEARWRLLCVATYLFERASIICRAFLNIFSVIKLPPPTLPCCSISWKTSRRTCDRR